MSETAPRFGQWQLSSKAHVIADTASIGSLTDAQLHHLFTVRRLVPGEQITIGDGRGGVALARVTAAPGGKRRTHIAAELLEELGRHQVEPLEQGLEMVLSIIDFERLSAAVRMLTEIGVSQITLVAPRRSHSVAGAERKASPERLARVAAEAAGQCRSLFVPEISFARLEDVLDRVVVCEAGAAPLTSRPRALLVGPEGGFEPHEVPAHVPRASLPGHVLRAETAAVVAAAMALSVTAT